MTRLGHAESRADCLACVRRWLDEVALHARGAPIVIVGTRKDAVPEPAVHLALSELLLRGLRGCGAVARPAPKPASRSVTASTLNNAIGEP